MLIALIGNSAESLLNFRASLIRRMAARGHLVAAFAPDYGSASRAAVERLGAATVDFPLSRGGVSPGADLGTLIALRNALYTLKPDAALSYFIKPAIYGNLAATLAGVPRRIVMLEGLGYGFAEEGRRSLRRRLIGRVVRALLRQSLARAHATLVLNDDDRRTVIEQVGADGARVLNMGGIGVELDQFELSPVRERATTFAMAARLIAEKGVRDYVEAARRIHVDYEGIKFLLLGDVDDNPDSLTRNEVAAWRDAGIIEWPGRVSDIKAWLKRADVFVFPSYYREGVPRSTQEAMALGRPIVTTEHVGCKDTVENGVNGFLVPPRDVDALVLALRSLIDTPELARRMGRASRILAEERFDASRADDLVIKLIEGR